MTVVFWSDSYNEGYDLFMFWKVDAISSKTSDGEPYNKRDNNDRGVSMTTTRTTDHAQGVLSTSHLVDVQLLKRDTKDLSKSNTVYNKV